MLMGISTLVALATLLYLTRQTSFWADEWLWITGRRANTIGTFLRPFNEHLSLVPIAIYRVMFAVFGLRHYAPYRALAIAGHLACALLVFSYVRARLGGLIALLAGILILFLGPGWQDMLWGFQIAWSIALAAGIGALLLLDRDGGRSDIAACVLIGVSLASTSVGIAIALGIAVDVALTRRRWADAWIVAIPLALYAIWALIYHPGDLVASGVLTVPSYLARAAAAALSGLVGLSGLNPLNETGQTLEFGVPLALALVATTGWLIHRRGLGARAVSLTVMLVVYWALVPLGRVVFSQPGNSRYIYVSCILALLLVVELARDVVLARAQAAENGDGEVGGAVELAPGVRLSGVSIIAVLLIGAAALLSNIGILRAGAGYLRSQGRATNADLAALNLVRGNLPPGYIPTSLPLSIFNPFTAQSYFAAERTLGTPAYSTVQLVRADPNTRATADRELEHAREIAAGAPQPELRIAGAPARVETTSAGRVRISGSCLTFEPSSVTPTQGTPYILLAVPPTGVRVSTSQSTATFSVRRFGASFAQLGALGPGQAADVTIHPDAAPESWLLQVAAPTATRICTLA